MPDGPVLRAIDAVVVRMPDLDAGLAFYRDELGHELLWRHDAIGQAGLRLPGGESELVLATEVPPGPAWLVDATGRVIGVEAAGRSPAPKLILEQRRYSSDNSGRNSAVPPRSTWGAEM